MGSATIILRSATALSRPLPLLQLRYFVDGCITAEWFVFRIEEQPCRDRRSSHRWPMFSRRRGAVISALSLSVPQLTSQHGHFLFGSGDISTSYIISSVNSNVFPTDEIKPMQHDRETLQLIGQAGCPHTARQDSAISL